MSEGYNGWSNYETWCVSLWLDNDEGTYSAIREMVAEHIADSESEHGTVEAWPLADGLQAFVQELPEVLAVTEGPASFVTDLLGAALSEVNWQEIAESLISETKSEVK